MFLTTTHPQITTQPQGKYVKKSALFTRVRQGMFQMGHQLIPNGSASPVYVRHQSGANGLYGSNGIFRGCFYVLAKGAASHFGVDSVQWNLRGGLPESLEILSQTLSKECQVEIPNTKWNFWKNVSVFSKGQLKDRHFSACGDANTLSKTALSIIEIVLFQNVFDLYTGMSQPFTSCIF